MLLKGPPVHRPLLTVPTNDRDRFGPGGIRTRTLQLDRFTCCHYTTGPDRSLRTLLWREQVQMSRGRVMDVRTASKDFWHLLWKSLTARPG